MGDDGSGIFASRVGEPSFAEKAGDPRADDLKTLGERASLDEIGSDRVLAIPLLSGMLRKERAPINEMGRALGSFGGRIPCQLVKTRSTLDMINREWIMMRKDARTV